MRYIGQDRSLGLERKKTEANRKDKLRQRELKEMQLESKVNDNSDPKEGIRI